MADCERALGKADEALRIVREAKLSNLTQRTLVELVIVEAGAREDLGQVKEGLRTLRATLGQVSRDIPDDVHARLAYAYAAMLLRHGQEDVAREWFATADRLDVARDLDAGDQIELLDGVDFEFNFDDEAEDDEAEDDEAEDDEAEDDEAEDDEPVEPADGQASPSSDAPVAASSDEEESGDD